MSRATRTLVVFARAPERGKVKTRLARVLGDDAALALYTAFLEDALTTARAAAALCGARLVVATAGGWSDRRNAHEPQPEGDLGVKMGHFIDAYHAGGVCIIGSDAPTLSAAHIARAFDALEAHEVVLGPSVDGGYWLLGARRPVPDLLVDMPWSTPRVLDETLRRLRGRSAALVDFWYDVDEPADLERLRAHLGVLPIGVASATRAALAE